MHPIREHTEYYMARGFFTLLRCCPAIITYALCRFMASIFYTALPSRRKITLKNLKLAFPEKTECERIQIARSAYDNFGRFMAESAMILAHKLTQSELLKMVDGSVIPELLELEKNNKQGILYISGHLGNFELLGHYLGLKLKRATHAVARQGANKLIDDKMVTPLRESFGNKIIYKRRALPRVAKALKKGEHAGLLIDIKSNPRQGVPVKFFNIKSYAIKSSAYLQLKLGVSVIPVAMVLTGDKQYKLVTGKQIPWTDNGKPKEEQIAELTQIHQTALEELIRQYPEQWLWMHDRWRKIIQD